MDFINSLFEDVKDIDLKKRARRVADRIPEVHLHQDTFGMKDFLLGVFVGSTLGFLISLLFAPQSGKETRAYISDKSQELGQKAKETVDEAVDKTGRLVEEGRERVESTLRKGQKEIDTAKNQGRDFAYETREQLSDTLDRAADEVDPKPRV